MSVAPYEELLGKVEAGLRDMPAGVGFPELEQAMRYSVTAGGKRLRPILLLMAAQAVGGGIDPLLPAAVAVELVHTYSLIHDDLPAMDDDEFRRGRPTCHRVFGEAMAILAGDALLTEAFTLMASPNLVETAGPERVLRGLQELGEAAGVRGLCSGQAEDLRSEGAAVDSDALERIHRRKTGRLFRAVLRIGGILGGGSEEAVEALGRFGEEYGLAFQIIDDILDETGSAAEMGKGTGKDHMRKKATYPSVWGLQLSRTKAAEALNRSLAAIASLGEAAEPLRELARKALERTR